MLVDYHVHCIAHGERASNKENYLAYLREAGKKHIQEVGFAEHDQYLQEVDYAVLLDLKESYTDVKVKIGVEMEMPEREDGFNILANYPLDYVIASIHFLDDWMFDHPDQRARYSEFDNYTLYKKYFEKMQRLLEWQGYNIIGHLDIIKVFGIRSDFDIKPLLEKGLKKLRNRECAVEINTAGTYKPIGEIYPSADILKWLYELDIPITLSSDAHSAQDTGRDIAVTAELAKKIGFRKLASFSGRKRTLINF